MSQRSVILLFFILIISGLAIAGYSQFKEGLNITPTPSPSPDLKLNLTQPSPSTTLEVVSPATASQNNFNQPTKQQLTSKKFDKFPGVLPPEDLAAKAAIIQTSKGRIVFQLFPDAPKASSNFIYLASNGFYNGLKFHRVEKDFVIQGGDPLGNGTGGPGYLFEDEPVTRNYTRGTVAMANAGVNTNGSQFFICLQDLSTLPPKYTIFGRVLEGMEVVDKIVVGDIMEKVSIAKIVQPSPSPNP